MSTKSSAKNIKPTAVWGLLQVVNNGIMQVIEAHEINVQKNRYKGMRAIAWQAFTESIEAGDFEELVKRAVANADNLPTGWAVNVPAKPAPKAAVEKRTAR